MGIRVLFICCDNAARSQMAEHLLNHFSRGQFEAKSAGTNPKPIHPLAIEALKEMHIDASGARSHHITEFSGEHFDYVINVCEQSSASCDFSCSDSCPSFPGYGKRICWGFEDVVNAGGDEAEQLRKFRRIRNEIANRIRIWMPAVEKRFAEKVNGFQPEGARA